MTIDKIDNLMIIILSSQILIICYNYICFKYCGNFKVRKHNMLHRGQM